MVPLKMVATYAPRATMPLKRVARQAQIADGSANAGGTQSQPAGQQAAVIASSMIARMVRAQRPHWALQLRQP